MTVQERWDTIDAIRGNCRYCDQYTGNDDTGCAGKCGGCKCWSLDSTVHPVLARQLTSVAEDEDEEYFDPDEIKEALGWMTRW